MIFRKRIAGLTESSLARFVARARQAARLKGMVDVVVTSNSEMKSLNKRFRGKDKATDVLSFPRAADEGGKNFAGELAISAEIATANARALGHKPAQEVKVLVIHGILHLRGYDHDRDDGQMVRRERQLQARFKLPSGLIDRALTDSAGRGRASARLRRNS